MTRARLAAAGLYLAFAALVLALAVASPAFRDPANLINLGRQVAVLGIAAWG